MQHGNYSFLIPACFKRACLMTLLLFWGSMLFAAIRYVKPGGAGTAPYTSWLTASNDLQAVINASVAGDEIWVAAGTYRPNRPANNTGTIDAANRDNAFVLKSGVKIYGGFAGTETLLSQRNWTTNVCMLSGDIGTIGVSTDNCYHVIISAGSVTTAELNGFTISNGNANGASNITVNAQTVSRNTGGGLRIQSSSPVITNCIISSNATSTTGGGIYIFSSTSTNFSNCAVTSNTAASGAGLYATTVSAATTFSNCSFSSNTASANGGGVYTVSSLLRFNTCILSGNTASAGGGIYIFTSTDLTLNNSLISGNTAATNGGGLWSSNSIPSIANCTFSGNRAATAGGGLHFNLAPSSAPKIYNSIVYDNKVGTTISNIALGTSATPPDVYYSIVENADGYTNMGNNGSEYPLFVGPQPASAAPTTAGDYRLQSNSPAINAGSNAFAPAGTDLAGNTRIQHSIVDRGAYEATVLPPTFMSFSPDSGPVGSLVTITGTAFNSPVVSIGGVPAITISSTGTSVTAMVMPGTTTGLVTVATFGGSASSSSNFTITTPPAPNQQQGGKIVGASGGNLGWSVALSADGNTAIIGEQDGLLNLQGGARVFIRSGNTWVQQTKLVGSGAVGISSQGRSVSLSADGNTAIIGGPADNNNAGAVWIFTRNNGVWSQQGNKLVGTGALGNASQGGSVSLSADGNTAIVGGAGDISAGGAVWVFTRNNGVWSQQGSKLVGHGAIGNAQQGSSVSLSADGNTALVGGPKDNTNLGAVWVFTRNNGVWNQQGNKMVGTGSIGNAGQGSSVSLSADGNTAIIGGPDDNSILGASWVFTRSNGVWTQQGNKLVGTGTSGVQRGSSVSLSADGNKAIIGSPAGQTVLFCKGEGAGGALIFTRSNGVWAQQAGELQGAASVVGNLYCDTRQGASVFLSADGQTAIIGAPIDADFFGAAWMFAYETPTINSFSPASGPVGTLVTITGTHLNDAVVSVGGVPAITISNTGSSLAVMVMPGTVTGLINVTIGAGASATSTGNFSVVPPGVPEVQQGTKLTGSGAIGNGRQGFAVAVAADGNTAVVGAPMDNGGAGATWIYTRVNGIWSQQGNKLVGTGAIGNAGQGTSVSISAEGNTVIVGGPGDNNNKGTAWIFTRNNGVWSQSEKLAFYDNAGNARLGTAVSLSADGNTAVIGGPNDNNNLGAVWVFKRSASIWGQTGNKLVGTGAIVPGNVFQGSALSLAADGKTVIVGGYADNNSIGAAWVFTLSGSLWVQQGNKLVGTGYAGQALQGFAVGLSADGNTAIVTGPYDATNNGAAWVYTRTAGVWSQQGSKVTGTGANGSSWKGWSVSLSADGNTAILGGVLDDNYRGATWRFTRTAGVWSQFGNKLMGTGFVGNARQGNSVSLSADGNTLVVGGPYDNSETGAVWAFTYEPPVNTWTGNVNNLWNEPGNWSLLEVPGSGDDIEINTGTPHLNVDFSVAGTLTLTGTGTLIVQPGNTLGIAPGGAANLNGRSVTFKSTAAGTASLGQVLGSLTGATNVTVERYIPNNGFRSWRLLSVPVTTSQTIRQAWQEGDANPLPLQNNLASYGTQITGVFTTQAAAAAAGFDSTSLQAGMLRWNGGGWSNITSTHQPINNFNSYFLYIRGERSKGVTGSVSNTSATTLRTTGTVYTGDTAIQASNSFSLIPNLYPSAINFTGLGRSGPANLFYIWDSKKLNGSSLGMYQSFSNTNDFNCLISGGSYTLNERNTTIESGQSFFVTSTGTVTLKESAKISGGGSLGFRPMPSAVKSKIDTRLYNSNDEMLDANAIVFDVAYSKTVADEDAPKMGNPGANFAIEKGGKLLAIEGTAPVKENDAIQFRMWNMAAGDYKLEFVMNNLSLPAGTDALLEDSYTKTTTVLNTSVVTSVSFTVDASSASSSANRFRIVIGKAGVHNKAGFTIAPNPIEGSTMNLVFSQQAAGQYDIRIISANGQAISSHRIIHAGGSNNYLLTLQQAVVTGLYKVEIICANKKRIIKSILVN